ncbi:MAG: fumarylacetoacetate hydrolase family protein [Actinobacteria bacterium]|nr:fumarylacetoacetate hydrolase family protein [Actinomycetota bacterium]
MRSAAFVHPDSGAHCAAEVRGEERVPPAAAELLAPVPRPRAIFGIGLNYADHAAETSERPPERPLVFMKPPSSSAPPQAAVHPPRVARAQLDHEVELALVIAADSVPNPTTLGAIEHRVSFA